MLKHDYETICSICNKTYHTSAYISKTLKMYYLERVSKPGEFTTKPICSDRCKELYETCPTSFDVGRDV